MVDENNYSVAFAVLIISSLIVFFNISTAEIQPWDEGLYAIRSRAIIQNNAWLDQTQWAVGGLYSASYPPLIPIALSLSIKLFGESTFAIRFFSAFCSILTLTTFFLYFSRKYSIPIVFLFTINLLLSFHWLYYSRQGMTEIPLVCFTFLTIIFAQLHCDSQTAVQRIVYGVTLTFVFFIALMTKPVVSLTPLIFLIALFIKKEKLKLYSVAPYFLLGLILATPWFVFMTLRYGNEFASVLLPKQLVLPIEENIQKLSIFYYANQLLIANPSLILGISNIILMTLKPFESIRSFNTLSLTFFLWGLSSLVLLSLARTQLPHYTIYLLIPINFFSMVLVKTEDSLDTKIKSFLLTILIYASVWYFLGPIRHNLSQQFALWTIAIGFLVLLVITLFISSALSKSAFISKISFENLVFVLNILLLILTVLTLQRYPTGKIFGGKVISQQLLKISNEKIIYLYHYYNKSDCYNPQIAWYTKGKYLSGIQQLESNNVIYFPLSRRNKILENVQVLNNYPEDYVLYYIADRRNLPYRVVTALLSENRPIITSTPNYVLFGKMKKNLQKMKAILNENNNNHYYYTY